jgi:hypothetical protein
MVDSKICTKPLDAQMTQLARSCDYVVTYRPGSHSDFYCIAHAWADTLIRGRPAPPPRNAADRARGSRPVLDPSAMRLSAASRVGVRRTARCVIGHRACGDQEYAPIEPHQPTESKNERTGIRSPETYLERIGIRSGRASSNCLRLETRPGFLRSARKRPSTVGLYQVSILNTHLTAFSGPLDGIAKALWSPHTTAASAPCVRAGKGGEMGIQYRDLVLGPSWIPTVS